MASAGEVRVSVAGASPAALPYDAASGNYVGSLPGLAWQSGDVVHFEATGGDVPAFSGEATVPDAVTVTRPVLGAGLELPRDADLAVTWTGGTHGRFAVALSTGSVGRTRFSVACWWNAADGQGSVPAAFLAPLPVGPAWLTALTYVQTRIEVDTWTLRLEAETLLQSVELSLR